MKQSVLDSNTWTNLTVYKQLCPGSFKNCYIQTICFQIIYLIYMYKEDLVLDNL